MRAFLAVDLPGQAREKLAGLVDDLREARIRGLRPLNSDGIHLTLKFLGDVPAEQVDRARDVPAPADLDVQNARSYEQPRQCGQGRKIRQRTTRGHGLSVGFSALNDAARGGWCTNRLHPSGMAIWYRPNPR